MFLIQEGLNRERDLKTMSARFFIVILSYLLISISIHPGELKIGRINKIDLGFRIGSYDCLVKKDTICLALTKFSNGPVYYYKIHSDSLFFISKNGSIRSGKAWWRGLFKLANDSILFMDAHIDPNDCFMQVNLMTHETDIFMELEPRGLSFEMKQPIDYYHLASKDYLLYSDWDYKKFVLAVDNANRTFEKQFLIEENNGKLSKPIMISEPGRINNMHFQSFMHNDTLYAVWFERKQKFLRWIELGPEYNLQSIIFRKFDGNSWSEPISAINSDESEEEIGWPIDFEYINNNFYIFFNRICTIKNDSNFEIYYMRSSDQINWSDPAKLTDSVRDLISMDGFWSAETGTDGVMHILCQSDDNDFGKKYYCTFDGKNWINQGAVIDEPSYAEKLKLDDENNIYIFWKPNYDNSTENIGSESDLYEGCVFYRKIESDY